jgi:antitoxin CcdA
MPVPSSTARKATNLTLAVGLVAEARELGVNVSQAAEQGIAAAVARRRQEQWLAENRTALDSSNAFVEQHGVPLSQYRNF